MKSETVLEPMPAAQVAAPRRRWMAVDDDEGVLGLLSLLLHSLGGTDVCCFRSPREALCAVAVAPPHDFEMVITDLEMPEMSGIELCRQLHKLDPELKVLLATGSGIITGSEAARSGFSGLLMKPFPLVALKHALETAGVINKRQANHTAAIPAGAGA